MPASISIANQVVIWPLAAGAQHGVQLAAIQGVAPSFGVELRPLVVRDAGEIEPAISAFARGSNGGLIVTIGTLAQAQRDLIITLARSEEHTSELQSRSDLVCRLLLEK